jgi:uncharacterized repeat protein (TIGR03803 family)
MKWLASIRALYAPKHLHRQARAPARRPRSASLRVRELETRLTPSLTTLASFDGTDGANLLGEVVMDGSGNLYGTTSAGGASGDGAVFELAKGSGTITTLASFNGTDGTNPRAGLIMDSSGNLYGTTSAGGASNDGTVFEVAQGSRTITTLASFKGTDGQSPACALLMDSSGNLYGTTQDAGASGYGTVFELAAGGGTITTLASFNGTDGQGPACPLVMDSSGNLYGTTQLGGAGGTTLNGTTSGTVFELPQGSSTITTLASFNGTNGGQPRGAVVMDGSGNLYGTTGVGGAYQGYYGLGLGTVFELPAGSSTILTVASFNGTDGQGPFAGLIMDSSGNLYGTTYYGGASNDGTVFEVPAPDQWTGANFAVDTNWSDGANWASGAPPTAGQQVNFTNAPSVKSFTSTVDAGFTNAIGDLSIYSTWGGTITVNSTLSVNGNLTLASGSFGGSGAVTVSGSASQWTGGQILVGAGGFTNTGGLMADTAAGNLVVTGAGTLTNNGAMHEAGANSLELENAAILSNAAGATFDILANGSLSESGGGTLTNAGLLEKTGTGTSTIAASTLDNSGTVDVNAGTLTISAAVTQVSGRTLTAGTWTVSATGQAKTKLNMTSARSLTTLGAGTQVTLSGLNATLTNLSALTTIAKGASFSLLGGQAFTAAGALTDEGSLTLGPGSVLTVGGNFKETSSGTLTIQLGGKNTAPTFGQLVSTTATVTLAGSLAVTSTVTPALGSSFELLDNEGNAAIHGIFKKLPASVTLKVKNGTKAMTFQITYTGTDDDGNQNVIITRVA